MIIGIIGKMQSGKSTVADMLLKKIPRSYSVAFADCLKEMIIKSGICTHDELYVQKTDFSRMIMQKIGTEIFRNQINPNYWISGVDRKIKEIYCDYGRLATIIIHDVRFKNEAAYIQNTKGILLRVTRNTINTVNADHDSETEQNLIATEDYIIENDNDLLQLEKNVDEFIEIVVKNKSKSENSNMF